MADKVSISQVQAAIEAAGAKWQAGVTSVSELPREEQQKRLGVLPPPGGFDALMRRSEAFAPVAATTAAGLPTALDWRNFNGQNFITPIRDQGGCGSCVAFGTCATIEAKFRVQRNDPGLAVDLSEAHLFFCLGKGQGVT